MSERLNGYRMDEWANQSAPRNKERDAAEPAGGRSTPEISMSLLVLRSPDIERTAQFYRLLGVHFERERHGGGPEHFAGQVGSVVFEIYPQGEGADTVGVRLGFQVASVDAAVEAARQNSETVLASPRRSRWGYCAVLADPDGRRVEIGEASDAAADGSHGSRPTP